MDNYSHYIVKHVVLDANFQFGGEKLFTPCPNDHAQSTFSPGHYHATI